MHTKYNLSFSTFPCSINQLRGGQRVETGIKIEQVLGNLKTTPRANVVKQLKCPNKKADCVSCVVCKSWLAVKVSKGSQRRLQVGSSWGRVRRCRCCSRRRRRSQSRQAAMPINCCLFSSSSQQSVNTSITWPLEVPWCVNFNSSNNNNNLATTIATLATTTSAIYL